MATLAETLAPSRPASSPAARSGDDAATGGWQPAGLVQWLRAQPRRRRENLLAAGFALAAAVWAPLGILAFLGRSTTTFLVLTAVAVAVLVAPRPSGLPAIGAAAARLRDLAADTADRTGPALSRLRALADEAVRRSRPLVRRAQEWGAGMARDLRDRAHEVWVERSAVQSSPRSLR